jgi:hypothetical protein
MKKKISITVLSILMSVLLINAQELDLKEASKLTKVNAKALKKAGVKKIMFVEFFGTFVTSKETAPSTMSQRYSSGSQFIRTQNVEISDDYYETVTNEVYELVKKSFTDAGIEVLDKAVLLENQDYIDLGLKEEKERREYTGGVTKQSVTSQTIVRSVTGMGMYSETLKVGAVAKINKMVPKIAHDNNCHAAITVKFRIGMGKKGAPVLSFINSKISYEIDSYGKGDKETFFFKKGGDLTATNKELAASPDIIAKDGAIDMEKYHEGILDMVETMTQAISIQLMDQLAD